MAAYHLETGISSASILELRMGLSLPCLHCPGFPHLVESPGFFSLKFPGPGKYWKMSLVLERPRNLSLRSWKVLEFTSGST